jgi:hypothetical protein
VHLITAWDSYVHVRRAHSADGSLPVHALVCSKTGLRFSTKAAIPKYTREWLTCNTRIAHTLFLIGRPEQRVEDAPLEADALGERELERGVDGLLGGRDGEAALARDDLSHVEGLVKHGPAVDDARDDAPALGLGGGERAAGEDELHRARLADEAREPLRAAPARDHAQRDLGLPEHRRRRGEHDVARERELAPAAERVAGHGRDERLARAREVRPALDEVGPVRLRDCVAREWGCVRGECGVRVQVRSCISLMSAPAANARSLPVMTIAPTAASASAATTAALSSAKSGPLSALSALGRWSWMSATAGFGRVLRMCW